MGVVTSPGLILASVAQPERQHLRWRSHFYAM
jgi:hypothetical protein